MTVSEDFAKLFSSNIRSYGKYTPSTNTHVTVKNKYEIKQIELHLEGKIGLGLVPIMDNNKCYWGAIDIDNHTGVEVNHEKIAKDIYNLGLPLIMCKSKSGGAHCYLFSSEAVPAHSLKTLLMKWSIDLGYSGTEVFPKQSRLVKTKDSKTKQLGNWINLPYFGGDTRVAFVYENDTFKELNLDEFVNLANVSKVNINTLEDLILMDYKEAPPCIQSMLKNGIDKGYRNEGIYNITVYFRKAFPKDYRERVINVNTTVLERPLSYGEVKKTIESASNKEYRYKCLEEPCKSYCDPETCLKREFGIPPEDVTYLDRATMPKITDIQLYDMDPPIWEMCLNDVKINITTQQLYNYRNFAQVVMEKLLIVLPPMKDKDWLNMLAGLMSEVKKVATPDNVGVVGLIKDRLSEFINRLDLDDKGENIKDREKLLRGLPIIQALSAKERYICFKGVDFLTYLRRMKSDELRGTMLWNTLRNLGVEYTRIRVKTKVVSVWMLQLDDKNRTKLDYDYMDRHLEDIENNELEPPDHTKETEGHQFKTDF